VIPLEEIQPHPEKEIAMSTEGKLQINEQSQQFLRVDPTSFEVFADEDYDGGTLLSRDSPGEEQTYLVVGTSGYLQLADDDGTVLANGSAGSPSTVFRAWTTGVPLADLALQATNGKLLVRDSGSGRISATVTPPTGGGQVPSECVFEMVVSVT
jgi:hypothetical protein